MHPNFLKNYSLPNKIKILGNFEKLSAVVSERAIF